MRGIKLLFTISYKEGDSSYIVKCYVNASSYSLLYNDVYFLIPFSELAMWLGSIEDKKKLQRVNSKQKL